MSEQLVEIKKLIKIINPLLTGTYIEHTTIFSHSPHTIYDKNPTSRADASRDLILHILDECNEVFPLFKSQSDLKKSKKGCQ